MTEKWFYTGQRALDVVDSVPNKLFAGNKNLKIAFQQKNYN